jgi:hypothetical protein
VGQREPLRWLHVPITFDASDHPDHLAGVGALPVLVSSLIRNVRVVKMLVDGGADHNLIFVKLMETPLLGNPYLWCTLFGLRGTPGVHHAYQATYNFYPWRTYMCATYRCDDSGAPFYVRHRQGLRRTSLRCTTDRVRH